LRPTPDSIHHIRDARDPVRSDVRSAADGRVRRYLDHRNRDHRVLRAANRSQGTAHLRGSVTSRNVWVFTSPLSDARASKRVIGAAPFHLPWGSRAPLTVVAATRSGFVALHRPFNFLARSGDVEVLAQRLADDLARR